MADIFDCNIISKIDMEKTVQNGKEICELYQPLVEKRLRQLNTKAFNSASIVIFSGESTGSKPSDKLLKQLSWYDDQIANYIKNIFSIQKKDKTIAEFLRLKCFYGYTDREISDKLGISERHLRRLKSRGYYYLAVYSNQVEFIYEKTHYIYFDEIDLINVA